MGPKSASRFWNNAPGPDSTVGKNDHEVTGDSPAEPGVIECDLVDRLLVLELDHYQIAAVLVVGSVIVFLYPPVPTPADVTRLTGNDAGRIRTESDCIL